MEESRVIGRPLGIVWSLVSDTNRLNRTIGLFPVDFSPFAASAGKLVRKAQGKAYGLLRFEWEENVFEWVERSYYSIERNYSRGPVKRVVWKVALEEAGDFKTRMILNGTFEIRSLIGKLIVKRGVIPQLMKTFIYAETAAELTDGKAVLQEDRTFEIDERLLEDAESHLTDLGIDRYAIGYLMKTIRSSSDEDVAHMKPYRWARQHGLEQRKAVQLFLLASEAGILDYEWSLMCPNCRVAKEHVNRLSEVSDSVHCDLCGADYELDFDRYIEMTFRVNGAIRKTPKQTFCVNGPTNSPGTVAQFRIPAGREQTFSWTPGQPGLQLRVLKRNYKIPFAGQAEGNDTSLRISETGLSASVLHQSPRVMVANDTEDEVVVAIEEMDWDPDALTAREVTALQLFRDLLPTEVLATGTQIGVAKMTILFTDLKDSTRLYEQVGDSAAYADVQKHFTFLRKIIGNHEGAIVKTIGDSVMAAFSRSADAMQAALAIQSAADELNSTLENPLRIKLGFHTGPVIAVNANGVLDYFGRTVNMAARVQQESEGWDIVVEESQFDELQTAVKHRSSQKFTASLHGVGTAVRLVRILPATDAGYALDKLKQQYLKSVT